MKHAGETKGITDSHRFNIIDVELWNSHETDSNDKHNALL